MAVKLYLHDIDLDNNQLFNARHHPISTAERIALGSTLVPESSGRIVYDQDLKQIFIWDGTQWVLPFKNNYVHTQTVASSVWTVSHNLNKFPSVTIVDSANDEVFGEVKHVDENNVIITFSAGFSGKAYFN